LNRERHPARTALFVVLAVALGLMGVEAACRWLEKAIPPGPVQALSPLVFQQLPEEPLLRSVSGFPGRVQPAAGLIDDGSLSIPVREEGELRVLVLGGSAVGGWSVARSATFSAVMGRALEGVRPGPIRVINFGRIGYASPQLAYLLEQTAEVIEPDVILVVMGNNERQDLAVEAELFGSADKAITRRELYRLSALARRLRPARSVHGTPDGRAGVGDTTPPQKPPQPDRIDRYARERYVRSLARMYAVAQGVGAQLILGTVATNHRYRPTRHEWSFLPGDAWVRPDVREAYFSWRFGVPGRGLAALGGARGPVAALLRGVLHRQAGDTASAVASLESFLSGTPNIPGTARAAKGWLWGTRLLHGPEAAQAALRPMLEQWTEEDPSPERACDRADLLWYAGDFSSAVTAYDACRGIASAYRADDSLNDIIRAQATSLDVPLVDLDAIVRARSQRGAPDYDIFFDYCHYTAAGNVFVGHVLAGALAEHLGLTRPVDAARAEDAFRRGWRARDTDFVDFARWVGVSADVPALAALRYGEDRIEHDVGAMDGAGALAFAGNRLRDRASVSELPWFEAAASSWCAALGREAGPLREPLTENLNRVLRGPAGNHLLTIAGESAVEGCLAGHNPWERDALPSHEDI